MHWLHTRWPAGGVERLPAVHEDFSTDVEGVYVVGDLTGVPLLKFSSDSGARAVENIAADARFLAAKKSKPAEVKDLIIIGAGVSGMAAALAAKKRGLDYLIVEATQTFSTVVNFPKRKPIYTYPHEMTPAGDLQFTKEVKEDLLDELRVQTAGIEPEQAHVEKISRENGLLICQLAGDPKAKEPQKLKALRVIVAIGRSGNFRKLGVPGEDLDKVYNRLHDPRDYAGKQALVVGGGDSALETAIALCQGGADVVLSYRKPEFSRPKPDNIERISALVKDPLAEVAVESPSCERITTASGVFSRVDQQKGSLRLLLPSEVKEIRPNEVLLLDDKKQPITLKNDVVFSMIGREAPLDFLRRSKLRILGETSPLGWVGLLGLLLFCTFLYAWKSSGPTEHWLDPFPENLAKFLTAKWHDRTSLLGTLAVSMKGRSFYYTLLYSSCIVLFGIQRIVRRKTPYVTRQTLSLIAFQLVPLFILPEIILPWLGYNGLFSHGTGKVFADHLFENYIGDAAYAAQQWPDWGHPRAYWRAYGFILAWPLSVYNVFTDQPMSWWLAISFIQTCVIIPYIVWRWGKGAFCGWICSCGALAETLGDTQRQKMPHGPKWNRLNMLGQVLLGIALVLLGMRIIGWLWPNSWSAQQFHLIFEGKNHAGKLVNYLSWKWVVDIFFGGILGVGLYFKYSGRMWCRFACPLAALMHIYARFSRFRIFPEKKKCISCNVCTSVCHMGIDVMNFANKGLPMQDPECVRCSACVQMCPTGVLSFGMADGEGKLLKLDKTPASLVQIRENPAKTKKPVAV